MVSSIGYVVLSGKMHVDRHEITFFTPVSKLFWRTLSLMRTLYLCWKKYAKIARAVLVFTSFRMVSNIAQWVLAIWLYFINIHDLTERKYYQIFISRSVAVSFLLVFYLFTHETLLAKKISFEWYCSSKISFVSYFTFLPMKLYLPRKSLLSGNVPQRYHFSGSSREA